MKKFLQGLAGTAAGLAVAFFLVILVEIYGEKIHPLPPGAGDSMEAVCAHVADFPDWVLATVVPMWGLTAFAGTWVAGTIGRAVPCLVVGALVLAALALNLSMLPYALWFKAIMPPVALTGAVWGTIASGGWRMKRHSPATPGEPNDGGLA